MSDWSNQSVGQGMTSHNQPSPAQLSVTAQGNQEFSLTSGVERVESNIRCIVNRLLASDGQPQEQERTEEIQNQPVPTMKRNNATSHPPPPYPRDSGSFSGGRVIVQPARNGYQNRRQRSGVSRVSNGIAQGPWWNREIPMQGPPPVIPNWTNQSYQYAGQNGSQWQQSQTQTWIPSRSQQWSDQMLQQQWVNFNQAQQIQANQFGPTLQQSSYSLGKQQPTTSRASCRYSSSAPSTSQSSSYHYTNQSNQVKFAHQTATSNDNTGPSGYAQIVQSQTHVVEVPSSISTFDHTYSTSLSASDSAAVNNNSYSGLNETNITSNDLDLIIAQNDLTYPFDSNFSTTTPPPGVDDIIPTLDIRKKDSILQPQHHSTLQTHQGHTNQLPTQQQQFSSYESSLQTTTNAQQQRFVPYVSSLPVQSQHYNSLLNTCQSSQMGQQYVYQIGQGQYYRPNVDHPNFVSLENADLRVPPPHISIPTPIQVQPRARRGRPPTRRGRGCRANRGSRLGTIVDTIVIDSDEEKSVPKRGKGSRGRYTKRRPRELGPSARVNSQPIYSETLTRPNPPSYQEATRHGTPYTRNETPDYYNLLSAGPIGAEQRSYGSSGSGDFSSPIQPLTSFSHIIQKGRNQRGRSIRGGYRLHMEPRSQPEGAMYHYNSLATSTPSTSSNLIQVPTDGVSVAQNLNHVSASAMTDYLHQLKNKNITFDGRTIKQEITYYSEEQGHKFRNVMDPRKIKKEAVSPDPSIAFLDDLIHEEFDVSKVKREPLDEIDTESMLAMF